MKYHEPEIVVPELEKLRSEPRYRPWSARDEAVLRRYYGAVPTNALAEKLGRTKVAVRMKAEHMGLVMK